MASATASNGRLQPEEIQELRSTATIDQLQELLCESWFEPHHPRHGVDTMGAIDSWFGVRALQTFLQPARFHDYSRSPTRTADVFYDFPGEEALRELSRILPNGPRESVPFRVQVHNEEARLDLIRRWNDWITTHEAELRTRQPTGEGVDWSESACKDGKPVRKQ
jgi:hypothetical protein